ncbi:hypothetical protein M3576_11690 [Weizmannia ginsengihumi]|nr:hypothetical protein [Heyndrickxia ginsengihumi]
MKQQYFIKVTCCFRGAKATEVNLYLPHKTSILELKPTLPFFKPLMKNDFLDVPTSIYLNFTGCATSFPIKSLLDFIFLIP